MIHAEESLKLVMGFNGSDAARRALARVRQLAIDFLLVMCQGVAVEARTAVGDPAVVRVVENAPCDVLVVA